MEAQGTNIIIGVLPTNVEKLAAGTEENDSDRDQFRVSYSNGDSDIFDTVLVAIGRRADTAKLNLESVGVKMNPHNGKIVGSNEQSSVPHIYAIGK